MKICPFISHMIGEDQAGVLEIQDGARAPSQASAEGGHLFCLRESCRFYRKDDAECSFDVVFERVEAQARAARNDPSGRTLQKVEKDLEKFWTLQTRSVAELVETIGETEKNTKSVLEDVERTIAAAIENRDDDRLDAVHRELARLHEAAQSREEGLEELSNTVSQMVMTFDDRLSELREHSGQLTARLETLESSLPTMDGLRECVREAIESAGGADTGETVRDLRSRFEEFVAASTEFERTLRQWQEKVDERVDDIHGGRTSWAERIVADADGAGTEDVAVQAERKRKSRKLNNLGVTSFHNGELELARDQFLEAISLDDDFAECFNNLGLVFTELGEDEKATEAFHTAVELNPDLHAAYNNLGYVFYKQGSYDQAIEMYNEALGRNASNSPAYTNLGNAYFKRGWRDEARKAWEKALELDPSNRKAGQSLEQLERETVAE